MIEIQVEMPQVNLDPMIERIHQTTRNSIEAGARFYVDRLREFWLNAPGLPVSRGGDPHPTRLHRDTGQLADTIFLTSENDGMQQTIHVPAEHARWHDDRLGGSRGFRDIWRRSFDAERGQILSLIDSTMRSQLGN